MRVLILSHAFNSLTQRLWLELRALGHEVSVEFDINDQLTEEAVQRSQSDVLVAPYLRRRIAERVWRKLPCWIVHPGPAGDRGPSALDWAVLEGAESWGVTLLRAEAEMDAGPILASVPFPMRAAPKSSLYRREVTEAAVQCLLMALGDHGRKEPTYPNRYCWRHAATQADRAIDWNRDDTATVLRKIHSADGSPGLRDEIEQQEYFLYDATAAPMRSGIPGKLIGRDEAGVFRGTTDGAIRIGHLRSKAKCDGLKLPAVSVLGPERVASLPSVVADADVSYSESNGVGVLQFRHYNGAMSTAQCHRLREAFSQAKAARTDVILLLGGDEHWCNGIHLSVIEAADSPADESWANISAMDDLVLEIITTKEQLVIAALNGNAGAGGVFLALAADEIWARRSVVLNPHYRSMGNLYGSEYWTYLLPKRVSADQAGCIVEQKLPMSALQAQEIGLIDRVLDAGCEQFHSEALRLAQAVASNRESLQRRLSTKRDERNRDECTKPLVAYRTEELARMHLNFYGFDPSFHVARYNFVHKVPKSHTPMYLATHRRRTP